MLFTTEHKKPRSNVTVYVIWDRTRGVYTIEIAEPLFSSIQRAIISEAENNNAGVFFTIEEKPEKPEPDPPRKYF